jgi:translocation and assembly module TamA
MRRNLRSALLGAAICLGFQGAGAADPVAYTVQFQPSGDPELDGLLKETASLVSLQKKLPAAPFALVGRARADQAQFLIVLHSLGYDAGSVDVTIAGKAIDNTALLDALTEAPATPPVVVLVTPHPGALFHLGKVTFGMLPPGFAPPALVKPGDAARAAPILAAHDRLLTALQNAGFAFATVSPPLAVADIAHARLNVSYTVHSGPRVNIGPVYFAGLQRADPDWLRRHLNIGKHRRYSDTGIAAARDSLLELGVFSSVSAIPQRRPDANGDVPVLFRVTEQKRHAVTIGGAYATDTGVTISASWEDRDVFRHAETLTYTVSASGLGGTGNTAPGYDLKGVFTKPDYYARRQTLTLSLEGLNESLTAYSRTALLANAGLARPVTAHLTFGYGLGFVTERVLQEEVRRNYVLVQLPLNLAYDTTDSALEPTSGVRANLDLTPTRPIIGDAGIFVIAQASASTYIGVENDARGIIALRALLGTIQGATQFQVPPDERFYAGGSSTVRGYTYQTVGPLFPDDNPEGGDAIDTGTIEFRQRVFNSFGIVPFLDAGQVSAGSRPFMGTLSVGAGLGLRYYTGIGPIRVDFAAPLKRTAGSGSFSLYIGLGEAF